MKSSEKTVCPHCNGRIPPGVVSGWAQTVRKRKRERPPPKKGSASLDQGDAPPRAELITMETPELISETVWRQVPTTTGGVFDFALRLLDQELQRANRSLETFHQNLNKASFFSAPPLPGEERILTMLPEKAFIHGVTEALSALLRQLPATPEDDYARWKARNGF